MAKRIFLAIVSLVACLTVAKAVTDSSYVQNPMLWAEVPDHVYNTHLRAPETRCYN